MHKEEQDKLDKAIEDYIRDVGWADSGVITSWVLISHQHNIDPEGISVSTYSSIIKGGDQAEHVTLGLIRTGERIIETVNRQERYLTDSEEE
jgi:hypothetical protein